MALTDAALTTLTEVKTELGITGSSEDAYLERLINAVSKQIASYCGRTFYYEADIVEKVAGYGSTQLVVARTPIVSVTSISFDGGSIDSSSYEISDPAAGFLYRQDGWFWTAGFNSGASQQQMPFTEDKDYEVTYTAGYITPHQDIDLAVGPRDLPYDLEDACVRMVSSRYLNKGRNLDLVSEKIGTASETYATSSAKDASGIPADIKATLNAYRKAKIA